MVEPFVRAAGTGEADDKPAAREQALRLVAAVPQEVREGDLPGACRSRDDALARARRVLLRAMDDLIDELRERVRIDNERVIVEERGRAGEAVVVQRHAGKGKAQR